MNEIVEIFNATRRPRSGHMLKDTEMYQILLLILQECRLSNISKSLLGFTCCKKLYGDDCHERRRNSVWFLCVAVYGLVLGIGDWLCIRVISSRTRFSSSMLPSSEIPWCSSRYHWQTSADSGRGPSAKTWGHDWHDEDSFQYKRQSLFRIRSTSHQQNQELKKVAWRESLESLSTYKTQHRDISTRIQLLTYWILPFPC